MKQKHPLKTLWQKNCFCNLWSSKRNSDEWVVSPVLWIGSDLFLLETVIQDGTTWDKEQFKIPLLQSKYFLKLCNCDNTLRYGCCKRTSLQEQPIWPSAPATEFKTTKVYYFEITCTALHTFFPQNHERSYITGGKLKEVIFSTPSAETEVYPSVLLHRYCFDLS